MSGARVADPLRDALRLQRVAARQGFDWRRLDELWGKLDEEIAELRAARGLAERREELGDLLFMLVNLARHMELHPGQALAAANRKFQRRYAHVMHDPRVLPPLDDPARLDAMEARWQEAKRMERRKEPHG